REKPKAVLLFPSESPVKALSFSGSGAVGEVRSTGGGLFSVNEKPASGTPNALSPGSQVFRKSGEPVQRSLGAGEVVAAGAFFRYLSYHARYRSIRSRWYLGRMLPWFSL